MYMVNASGKVKKIVENRLKLWFFELTHFFFNRMP